MMPFGWGVTQSELQTTNHIRRVHRMFSYSMYALKTEEYVAGTGNSACCGFFIRRLAFDNMASRLHKG